MLKILMLPLKVGQTEDDVITVSYRHTEALDEMLDEVGAPVTADSVTSGVVRGQ